MTAPLPPSEEVAPVVTPEAQRRWLRELARLMVAAQLDVEARRAGEVEDE